MKLYRKNLLTLFGVGCMSLSIVAQRPVKVACVGNSITAGYLLKDPTTESYPSRLQQLLGEGYEVGNFGHSGATLLSKGHRPYIQTEEFRKALAFDADIVIVHLGLNDTDPRNWPNYAQYFERDYLKLLDTLGIQQPHKQFYIAKMSPLLPAHRRYYTSSRDWFKQVNQAITQVGNTKFVAPMAEGQFSAANRVVTLLDFSVPFSGRWHLFPDALHPNAEGANLLAHYVYQNLKKQTTLPITLHPYYRDNMIIQRGQVKIKGKATPGHTLQYQAGKQKVQKTLVDSEGNFVLHLDCRQYGSFDLHITDETSGEKCLLRNIQVGEVWIASGQSNMAMTLGETAETTWKTDPSDDLLHYVDMQPIAKTDNREWSLATLDAVNAFQYYQPYRFFTAHDKKSLSTWSAVAYYFARKLRKQLNCPVAIIHNAIGGSPIESWLNPDMLEREYPDLVMDWQKKEYAQDWVRERSLKNIALRPKEQTHPYAPGYLHIAGWQPIKDIPHRGVIWYQGESNAHAPEVYVKYFNHLLDDFKTAQLADQQTNVYAVQLSAINRPSWVYFRTQQAQPRDLYVPSYDLGDSLDVHPRRKALVGERLALRALDCTYHQKQKSDAPQVVAAIAQPKAESLDVIVLIQGVWGGLKSADGKALQGFELHYANGKSLKPSSILALDLPRRTQQKGYSLLLLKDVPLAQYVALSYANEAFTRANVMGGNGMPLLPFNNLPLVTEFSGLDWHAAYANMMKRTQKQ